MRLSFYLADTAYIEYLRTFDHKVPINDKRDGSRIRTLIGIVLQLNDLKFYAPMSSPKPKHLTMKDLQDLVKIDGGALGVINLNNMVPINDSNVFKIDISNYPIHNQSDVKYVELLKDQLTWCNISVNKEKIVEKALKLYGVILSGKARPELVNRCCEFSLLVEKCKEYKLIS